MMIEQLEGLRDAINNLILAWPAIEAFFGSIFDMWTVAVATASTGAAIFPTPKQGGKAAILYKAVDFLAVNIGKAKDKGF